MGMKRTNLMILTIVTLLFLIIGCGNNLTMEQKFLKKNYENINLDKPLEFNLIKNELTNKEIFLSGEFHRIYPNKKLELGLIKYLKENANLKYLILELSCSDAIILNKYLSSGDEGILRKFFEEPTKFGALGFSQDTYQFYKDLCEYNNALPEVDKLKVIGVDLDYSFGNSLWGLKLVLEDFNNIKDINEVIGRINQAEKMLTSSTNPMKELYDFSLEISKDIDKNEYLYKSSLGEKYFDFKIAIDNLKFSIETHMGKNGIVNDVRDKNMFENFKKYYTHLPQGKYFGQFGMNHTFQQSIGDKNYFATELNHNESSPVRGKVLTIAYLYDTTTPLSGERNCSKEFLSMVSPITKSEIAMFKLHGKDSPFSSKFYKSAFPLQTAQMFENTKKTYGSTTDFYQYIILIKNVKDTLPGI